MELACTVFIFIILRKYLDWTSELGVYCEVRRAAFFLGPAAAPSGSPKSLSRLLGSSSFILEQR